MLKILGIEIIEDPTMPLGEARIKSTKDEVTIINIEGS